MKSTFLIFLFTLNFSATLIAQPYFFEQDSEPYTNLTGTTSINGAVDWTPFQSFTVPIGFNFDFMGNTYSTIYIEGSGFTRFDASYYYLINPFTVQMQDKGAGASLSPLSYKLDGVTPNRILKIEWNNCGFVNDAVGTANFQMWLYETSNIIEVHVGAVTASAVAYTGNGDTGPAIGIYEYNSVTYCVYGIGLLDNPASPNDSIIQNANADLFDFAVNGTPASGTVYRFVPGALSINENGLENTWNISLYQNVLTLEQKNTQTEKVELKILDASGKIIFQKEIFGTEKIDLNSFIAGIHFCVLTREDGTAMTKKILVHK